MISLEKIRPLLGFENDYFLSRTGSYSLGFILELPPVFSMTETDYQNASDIWSSIFRSLPEFTVVHKMDVFSEKEFKPLERDKESILYRGYKEKFNEKKMTTHLSYVFFTKGSSKIKSNNSYHSSIFRSKIVPKEFSSDVAFSDFDTKVKRVVAVLNDSKYFSLKPLTNKKWIDLCNSYESLQFGNDSSISADIFQNEEKTMIGKNEISIVSINDISCLPNDYKDYFEHPNYRSTRSGLSFSLLFPVGLELKGSHIVNQCWVTDTKENIKNELKTRDSYSKLFAFADKSNEMNVADNENFLELLEGNYYPVSFHANVMIWDEDKNALRNKENKAIASFNKVKLIPNVSTNEVLSLYWAFYPGNTAELGAADQSFLLLDKQAGAFNIMETSREDDQSDFGIYLSDRMTGCPVFVDISDLPKKKGLTNNSNKLIFGPSGSGKSVMCNTILENYLNYDVDIVIVDVGDSYQRLNKLNNGVYLSYGEDSPINFNPFVLSKSEQTPEKIMFLNTLIETLWKKEGESTTKDEDVLISKSIKGFLEHINNVEGEVNFNRYYDYLRNHFIPEQKENKTDHLVNSDSFLNCLSMFYKGGDYEYLLNSSKNTGLLSEEFIVFELDNIKDHDVIFPVVTLMIMDTYISKLRSKTRRGRKKIILIEEAWKAIAREGMAKFLQYLFKTVRKLDGEAIIVTQEVEDILGNPIIKNAIIKNCGAKILMDMREYANSMDKIATMLSLDQNAIDQVSSLNMNNDPDDFYKETTIVLGNSATTYRVSKAPEEIACYTTNKREIEVIENLENRFRGDTEMAIIHYASQLKAN